jgi:hypothetical protein
MKRLARQVVIAGLAVVLTMPLARQAAVATPFSDVPANHWAYQYIQSLAADGVIDGYPDGKFKGDRPLTRYEMAVVVARVIAKLQENQSGVKKEDLDKLQKLVDALKDELDALGVRVTNLEDSLDALDKRTKFAQSLSMHGLFLPNVSFRQRPQFPRSIVNTTGSTVSTYWGGSASAGRSTTGGSIDPFVQIFLISDDSNNPLTNNGDGVLIRQDSRFALAYQISDQLTVSLPVHILNYEYGGEFTQQANYDIEPGIDLNVAHTGNISNLHIKFGIIDNISSSRTGLAFRAPVGYSAAVPYENPVQPYQRGMSFTGTVGEGAFGLTDFEGSFTRIDDTLLNTQTTFLNPSGGDQLATGTYFFPVVPNQFGYTQTTPAGTLKVDTFNAGSGVLGNVYLTNVAVDGTVYISYYNGTYFNSSGSATGGPANVVPGFTYNANTNQVVFTSPLPAGSVVQISYRNLGETNNAVVQRYMAHFRANQKFKGFPGAEIGVSFNRIFDVDETYVNGDATQAFQAPVNGQGLVSDTVLGIDAQFAIPYNVSGPGSTPIIFGEAASSKFTSDYRNVAAVGDTAGVVGLRLKLGKVLFTGQYQNVGPNFFVGAPFRYFGNAPPLFAFYRLPYLPDFFGFGNNLGINQQFDNAFATAGLPAPYSAAATPQLGVQGNPNLTFLFPLYNTLKATGPEYFSNYAPNSQGETLSVNAPVRAGDLTFDTTVRYQHLQELRPNSLGSLLYGPAYATNQTLKYDTFTGSTQFAVPAFGQKLTASVSGTYETLKRLDMTPYQFYPINPATQTYDGTAFASAQNPAFTSTLNTYGSGSPVSFYPNYINMRHSVLSAALSMPLTRALNLAGTYTTQRYGGEYGTTLAQNISQRKDYYTGSLTYNIPNTNSSLSFLARHYGYQDNVLSTYDTGQNRQDVNFTVRF